jgi:hypothetical protein
MKKQQPCFREIFNEKERYKVNITGGRYFLNPTFPVPLKKGKIGLFGVY